MATGRERLARHRARPLLVELHHALSRLTSTLTVMNTGAHPDDEQSGLLALLRYGMGMRVVIACSTRGEGGQNSLGPERGERAWRAPHARDGGSRARPRCRCRLARLRAERPNP